jgi:hypothetical protein
LSDIHRPASGGPACGALAIAGIAESRLPIHLQYSFTEPGTYNVRFVRNQYRHGKLEIAEQSDWTPLHLQLAPPGTIEHWLDEALANLPHSAGPLLGDVLPSLLASRDERVLNLMLDTTYHPDSAVAGYAANSLVYFDKEQVRTHVLSALKERGPNEALGFLFTTSDIAKPIAAQIITACLPYLRSSGPEKVVGALHVLSMLRDPAFHLPPEMVEQISSSLEADIDVVIAQKNQQAAWWLANFLGTAGRLADRPLLWKLVDAGLSAEQSLICITWFRNPADLPRIAEIVKQATYNSPTDPHGYSYAGVVSDLQTEYGSAAQPYLRDVLAASKQTWVLTAAAQGLVKMNDRAGWQFFINVVNERPFYKDEMEFWIKNEFPEIRNADDAEIIKFLNSRASD